jgi:hypothetical protein
MFVQTEEKLRFAKFCLIRLFKGFMIIKLRIQGFYLHPDINDDFLPKKHSYVNQNIHCCVLCKDKSIKTQRAAQVKCADLCERGDSSGTLRERLKEGGFSGTTGGHIRCREIGS